MTKRTWKTYKTWDYDADPKRDAMIRILQNQNITDVSKRTGVSRSTYANWQQKKVRRPTGMLMDMTAAELGYTLYNLTTHEFTGRRSATVHALPRARRTAPQRKQRAS